MIGQVIHNYRFEKLLGEGGMGVVYQATELALQRTVAIKILHSHLVNDSVFFDRFKNEAILLAHLSHPNVTTLFNFFTENKQSYMVMEYVEGSTLEDFLNKDLSPEFVIRTIIDASEGLAHAHERGILHRDIKPSNIMVTKNGTVKLMDFGIAKMKGSTSLTRIGSIIGTLEYLAPELLSGEAPSAQSDLYAMGVVIYELLSGKLPFEAKTEAALINEIIHKKPVSLRSVNSKVPKQLDQIVEKLLNKKPEKRYGSAKELKEKLQQVEWVKESREKQNYFGNWAKEIKKSYNKPEVNSKESTWRKLMTTEGYMVLGGIIMTLAVLFFGLRDSDSKTIIPDEIVLDRDTINSSSEINKEFHKEVSDGLTTGSTAASEYIAEQKPANPESKFNLPSQSPKRDTKPTVPKENDKPKINPDKNDKSNISPDKSDVVSDLERKNESVKNDVSSSLTPTIKKNIYVKNQAVQLELNMDVSSDDPLIKDKVIYFRVVYDVIKDGVNIIPAGTLAEGKVVRVKPTTSSGKPYLEIQPETVKAINGSRLKLKSPPFGTSGSNSSSPVIFKKKTKISPNPTIVDQSIVVEVNN